MKPKISLLILVLIIIFGAALRLYRLGTLPDAFSPDEVAQGYTAYSILETGKDEWGSTDFFLLRSFGDFKLPLQTFLMIPSIKLFGLSPFAIRFPNAMFAVFSILTVYLFIKRFTGNNTIALITSGIIAFSPWHLPMSRIALEANLNLFFITIAAWLFLISSKNKILQILSAFFFALNLLTYHSSKFFTPVFVVFLIAFLITTKSFTPKTILKKYLTFLIVFLMSAVTLFILTSDNSRASDIAIYHPTDNWQAVSNDQYLSSYFGLHPLISRIFNNKLTYIISTFVQNYLSVFSPQFLITGGAGETTYGMIPGIGVLGLAVTFSFVCGLILLLKPKFPLRSHVLFFLILILISSVPASLAKSHYSANRLAIALPFFQSISAIGFYYLFKNIKSLFIIPLFFLFCFESLFFFQKYFYQGQSILAEGMLYGHRQANLYIKQFANPNTQVIYSRKTSQPQAFFTFFQSVNPALTQNFSPSWLKYQTENKPFLDQLSEYNLANNLFREVNFPSDKLAPNTILVARPDEILPENGDYVIYSPDPVKPKPLFVLYNTQLHPNENL